MKAFILLNIVFFSALLYRAEILGLSATLWLVGFVVIVNMIMVPCLYEGNR